MNITIFSLREMRQAFAALAIFALVLLSAQGIFAQTAHAAPPAADLEQCRNGDTALTSNDCEDLGGGNDFWVSGNVGDSNSHYTEGESVPYRSVLTDMVPGVEVTITYGYDIKHSGKHALDYLTSYDRIAEFVDPISGVSGVAGAPSTFPIPAPSSVGSPVVGQPTASFNALPAGEKVMSIWNGTITDIDYVDEGDLNAAQDETTFSVTFTPTDETVVIAWGGHIGSRLDWGYTNDVPNSAGGISGSPYHMRLKTWTLGNLGSKDRSLSADAVAAPGNVTITKVVTNDNGGTLGVADFPLFVGDTEVTSGVPTDFDAGNYTVSETEDAGYSASQWSGDCDPVTGALVVEEGEMYSCTITNDDIAPSLTLVKNVVGGPKIAADWTLEAEGPTTISGAGGATSDATFDAGTYTLSEEFTGQALAEGSYQAGDWSCTNGVTVNQDDEITLGLGQSTTCSITNTYVAPDKATLHIVKNLVQDDGGTDPVSDFTFSVSGDMTENNVAWVTETATYVVDPGTYSVVENINGTVDGRYTVSYENDLNDNLNCSSLVLVKDAEVTCTITNDDIAPELTVIKQVVDSALSGDKNPADFTMTVTGTNVSDDSFAGSETGVTVTLDAGVYSVSEENTFGYAKNDSDLDCDGSNNPIDLGEERTCTIINTEPDPTSMTITFEKVVQSGDADPSEWTFDVVGGNVDTTVDHGDSLELPEGTYTVTENGPEGYRLVDTSGVCADDGEIVVDVDDLGTGGTCTFTNEIIPLSSITIDKVVTGYKANEDLAFAFTSTGAGTDNFQLSDNGTPKAFTDLSAGTYTFTETDGGSRWELTDISCVGMDENRSAEDEANGMVTLDLEEGEHVTCTFTNDYTDDLGTDDERITVRKEVTQGSDIEVLFDFVLTNLDTLATTSFELAHGNEFESEDLSISATYSVTESMPDQFWSQESVVCTSDDANVDQQINPSSIELADGENVECVFTNDQMLFEIYGYVWEDTDEDGFWDEGEQALTDWDVHATNGSKNFSTVSGEGGFYSFMVPAGTWTISETVKSGWDQTFPFPEDEGVHVVTVPQVEESESAFLDSIKSFFIETAHAQVQQWQTHYGAYDFGNVREPSDGGGGGGGSTAPRCDMFEAEVDGDEIVLTWETRRGTDLTINADGDEIFSTDDSDEVDEGSLTVDNDGQEEFELVVSRGSREDECAVNIDRPTPQVLGEQVSAVPLGAANTGAGGASPIQVPKVPFATLVGAMSLRRNG